VPRGDSGTRGLVDDPAQDETQRSGTTVLVVKVCHDHDLPARFCLSNPAAVLPGCGAYTRPAVHGHRPWARASAACRRGVNQP